MERKIPRAHSTLLMGGNHKWGIYKTDGLWWKILGKWMIWGYPYFRKPLHGFMKLILLLCFSAHVKIDFTQLSQWCQCSEEKWEPLGSPKNPTTITTSIEPSRYVPDMELLCDIVRCFPRWSRAIESISLDGPESQNPLICIQFGYGSGWSRLGFPRIHGQYSSCSTWKHPAIFQTLQWLHHV